MKRVAIAAAILLALAACGPKGDFARAPSGQTATDARSALVSGGDAPAPPPADEAPAAAPAEKQEAPKTDVQPGGALLAYTYAYGIETPAKAVASVMKAHEKICTDAGPALCQVLGASTSSEGEDDVTAQLSLRGEPHWLVQFRARLESDAEKAGGKVKSTNTTTEDLTRDITDTEANLRAQKTLRDRLQNLLASRPGKLSELLDVERELARVQGEIDSIESNLAVMKTRVAMSALTIDYTSAGAPLTDTTFQPIKDALEKFMRTVSEGFAVMILFIAAAAPWLIVLGGGWWLFMRWRRRQRIAKAPPTAPTP